MVSGMFARQQIEHYYYYQGGKPDTGKFHSSYIGMNVCGSAYENGAWSMAHVLRQRIEYYQNI